MTSSLAEMDKTNPKVPCLICGEQNHRLLLRLTDGELLQCLSCSFVFQGPFEETHETLSFEKYYDLFSDVNIWTKSRKKLFHHFLHEIEKRVEGRRLLDAGAGIGYFVHLAKKQGWDALGVDLSEKACHLANDLFGATVLQGTMSTLRKEQDPFDALVFLDSLYYSRNPSRDLKEAYSLLRSKGIVALRLTNVHFHFLTYRIFQWFGPLLRWSGVEKLFVFHFCLFSPKTIRILLEKCGYHEVKVWNSPLTSGDPYDLMKGLGSFGVWAKSFIFFIISVIAWGSRGKILIGPSLEVYARKP